MYYDEFLNACSVDIQQPPALYFSPDNFVLYGDCISKIISLFVKRIVFILIKISKDIAVPNHLQCTERYLLMLSLVDLNQGME